MRRIAIGRTIGLLLVALAIFMSVWLSRDAFRLDAEFLQWVDVRPMESAIDLSKPGETTAEFLQTCSSSHGETLVLECDLDDQSKQNLPELLHGFSADIVIKDSAGNEVVSEKISEKTVMLWDDKILITRLARFPKGKYVATIHVTSGAPALADKPQIIYAKYQLCGLERAPAMILGALAVGAGVIGLFVAFFILPGLLAYGIWRPPLNAVREDVKPIP